MADVSASASGSAGKTYVVANQDIKLSLYHLLIGFDPQK